MRDSIGLLAAVILTLGLAAGCQSRETEEGAGADTAVDTGTAGAMDEGGADAGGAEDREAVAAVSDRWEQGALAGDAAGVASLYAEDAVLLAPGAPTAEGRAAIQSTLAAMFEAAPATEASIESGTITFSESGDLAYDVGTYTMAGTTPAGEAWRDEGKYLAVLRNVGGEWKLVADTWNSDAPPAM